MNGFNWDGDLQSCDEYPYNSSIEGGTGAFILATTYGDNQQHKGRLVTETFQNSNTQLLADLQGTFDVCVIVQVTDIGGNASEENPANYWIVGNVHDASGALKLGGLPLTDPHGKCVRRWMPRPNAPNKRAKH
jgi:hypothetical protein